MRYVIEMNPHLILSISNLKYEQVTSGGNALKFFASQRLDIRRIGQIKERKMGGGDEMVVVGNRTRVKVAKNKLAPPFKLVSSLICLICLISHFSSLSFVVCLILSLICLFFHLSFVVYFVWCNSVSLICCLMRG